MEGQARAQAEELGVPPAPPRVTAVSVLRNRAFRLFFVGNLVSQSGTFLQNSAQTVLMHDLTGRNTAVGLTNAATFFPVLLLAVAGGELADRYNRRALFVATQAVSLAAVAVLAVVTAVDRAGPGWVYATAAVLGLSYAVAIPTMHALVPSLVEPDELGPAVGLTAVTFNLARVVGPALAAAALATVGFAWAFGLNGLSFLALIVALLLIRVRPHPAERPRTSMREGFRYAWRDPGVRGMLVALAALAFALDPVNTLAPAFASDVFHRSSAAAPVFLLAFGLGSILAAAGLGRLFRRPQADPRQGVLAMLVTGAGIAGFALSPVYEAALAAAALAGAGSLASITLFTTGIQQRVPEAIRGRVMALWTICALGSRFPSGVIDGVLADAIGPRAAALALLAPLALVTLLVLPRIPAPD
jgi:MFS family permease